MPRVEALHLIQGGHNVHLTLTVKRAVLQRLHRIAHLLLLARPHGLGDGHVLLAPRLVVTRGTLRMESDEARLSTSGVAGAKGAWKEGSLPFRDYVYIS